MKTTAAAKIGTNKLLLFDDAYTEAKSGFALTMNPVVREPEPVIVADRPWEIGSLRGDSQTSVIDDDGLLKLWYVVTHPATVAGQRAGRLAPAELKGFDEKTANDIQSRARNVLCYATSTDGVHWDKPALDVMKYRGRRTNMVFVGRLGCTVFKDPTAPAASRYKMITGSGPRLPHVYKASGLPEQNIYHAIYGARSPDGIHWRAYPKPIIQWYTDTTNVAYWDDQRRRYVAFCRINDGMTFRNGRTVTQPGGFRFRAIGRTESKDFRHFPPPRKIAEPSPAERTPRRSGMDYYNSSAVKYAHAPDSYFLFSSSFYHDSDLLDVHLATSRDGVHYHRWKQPLLGLGPQGAFDCRRTYMATGMVRRDDELHMYYLGASHSHSGQTAPAKHRSGIGHVRTRLDGFVSQDARISGGRLLTVPLRFEGRRLTVNMDASAGGRLKVELRDAANRPIPGYTARDADWLYANDVQKTVTWSSRPDLPAIKPQTLRLHFIAKSVKLYALQFQPSS